uniref:Uncharacterized protein n=1 Tax=Micrurus lemniscatus lemniscatus TaxID=129467 RepID=A0A2D4JRL4_MICLE
MLFLGQNHSPNLGVTDPSAPSYHQWDQFELSFPYSSVPFSDPGTSQFLINCKATKLGELRHFFLTYFNALYTLAAHSLVLQLLCNSLNFLKKVLTQMYAYGF